MNITITKDELYEICNALNTHAADLERTAKADRRKAHTYQQIGVIEEAVRNLRALSRRLIEEKQAA